MPDYVSDIAEDESLCDEHEHHKGKVQEIDAFLLPPVDLDEDTFGMSICSLTRDTFFISEIGFSCARVSRIITSLFLVLLTIVIQIWLLSKVKEFVCARSVHDIRIAYDKYEVAMCGLEGCSVTVNGKHRCKDGFFPPIAEAMARLDKMSDGDKDDICRIPLSQPYFFGLILLIWTLTCFAELRKTFHMEQVIIMLPTVGTMSEAIVPGDDDTTDLDCVIVGMTRPMKFGLTLLTFVPRLGVTLYLLWVGCRWLLATNAFGDLILNAVALEFVLLIKDGLYSALMPTRSHLDLSVTKIIPYPDHMTSSWWNMVNTMSLLVIAVLWVYFYMTQWQQVLPGYRWDIHTVCVDYIKERYAV